VGDNTCTGIGSNKRLAKRSAAEQMLQMLGYSLLAPQPSKPAIKSGSNEGRSVSPSSSSSSPIGPSSGGCSGDKRVTFVEPDATQSERFFGYVHVLIFRGLMDYENRQESET
jgi:Double-stranded RNA binding motif